MNNEGVEEFAAHFGAESQNFSEDVLFSKPSTWFENRQIKEHVIMKKNKYIIIPFISFIYIDKYYFISFRFLFFHLWYPLWIRIN